MRKTNNYLKETKITFEKLHLDFSEELKEEKPAGNVGIFCQNLAITVYSYFQTLENFSNFKNNFSFNNTMSDGRILEIHDYFTKKK